MADMGAFLKQQWGPAPAYVWAGGTLLAAVLWNHYQSGKTAAATQAAAATQQQSTASLYGSYANQPADAAPQFVIQNQMPAQPVTVTPPGTGSTPPTTTPPSNLTPGGGSLVINVGKGQTVGGVLAELKTKGFPNLNWSDIWAWNPDLIPKYGLSHMANGDWGFTQYSTPLTINAPNTFFDTSISGDK